VGDGVPCYMTSSGNLNLLVPIFSFSWLTLRLFFDAGWSDGDDYRIG